MTKEGLLLHAQRKSVSSDSGLWSCSVAENIHPQKDASPADPRVPDPYRTVVRGIAEELSPEISSRVTLDDVVLLGVCFNLDSMHPSMLFLARVPLSLKEILANCRDTPGKDFMEGVQHWLPGDAESSEWPARLSEEGWVAGGKAAVIRALEFLRYHSHTQAEVYPVGESSSIAWKTGKGPVTR